MTLKCSVCILRFYLQSPIHVFNLGGEFYMALFEIRSSISAPKQTSQHTGTPFTVLTSQNATQTAHILTNVPEVVHQSLSHRLMMEEV
jgi:hypothetical protein